MPAPDINPDLLAETPDDGSSYGTTTRGNHATHGDAFSGGNHHIDKSCVVRQNIYCAKALEASAYTVRESTYGDPQDPQYDPEHEYVSPGTLVPGFVKNDAEGNFLFGQGDGNGGVTALTQLDDVTLTSPAAREYLCFDSPSGQWVNEVILINDLGDVVVTTPADGQHLMFDGGTSKWVNKNANALDDLVDVTLTAPANGELLRFNGSEWVNNTLAEAGVAAAAHTHVEADITDLQAYLLDITGENLGDLANVSAAAPNSGDHLQFDGVNWIAAAPGHTAPGAASLNDLSDVVISAPANKHHLKHNGTNWINAEPFITDNSDVTTSGINDGDLLVWSVSTFVNAKLAFDDLTDVDTTGAGNRSFLSFDGSNWVDSNTRIRLTEIVDGSNDPLLAFQSGAGPDHIRISSGSPTNNPQILATSTANANIGLDFATSGLGTFQFKDAAGDTLQTQISSEGVEVRSDDAYYLGDSQTNGTWRLVRVGTDLQVELREAGTYNSKGSFTP